MGVRRFAGIARRALTAARRYASDPAFRARVGRELARDRDAAPAAATRPTAYAGLVSSSAALGGIRVAPGVPHLNVVVGSVGAGRVFAGIDTALRAAVLLAERLGLPLRVVTIDPPSGADPAAEALRERYGVSDLDLVGPGTIGERSFAPDDIWMATHFFTAHAIDVACGLGLIQSERVVYLVQDYEPGFVPWSTEYAVAQSTYHAGFVPLVNSLPVARYLATAEGIAVPDAHVFAPAFDLDRLARVAEARRPSDVVRIGFYGRPSKHRNLFRLGVASLRRAAERLGDDPAYTFVSVGERHADVDLAGGHQLTSLGTLSWDGYFEFLAEVDVFLSLQMSPHPSHPPLEAAMSGAWAVTNDVGGARAHLHRRLTAVPARVEALADAVVAATRQPTHGFLALEPGLLGGELSAAVDAVAAVLAKRR